MSAECKYIESSNSDRRIAYGARCTWWGPIYEVGVMQGTGLPCCPSCKGVLFEVDCLDTWWKSIDERAKTKPGYRQFVEWSKGRCFPNFQDAAIAYARFLLYE